MFSNKDVRRREKAQAGDAGIGGGAAVQGRVTFPRRGKEKKGEISSVVLERGGTITTRRRGEGCLFER